MKKAPRFAFAALYCSIVMIPARAQQGPCAGSEAADVQFQARTFPVQKIGRAVLFHAGMSVDADGAPNAYAPRNKGLDFIANAKNGGRFVGVATRADGEPIVQRSGRFKGFYVSTTSLRNAAGSVSAAGTYVDATKIPYIVLPPEFMEQFGVALGDLAVVINRKNGKSSPAIFADTGPRGKIGEGSIALARALGLDANPRRGGTSTPSIAYLVFPRSGLGPGKLRTAKEIKGSALKAFREWGGAKRLKACSTERWITEKLKRSPGERYSGKS
jgi:hypothetical protein